VVFRGKPSHESAGMNPHRARLRNYPWVPVLMSLVAWGGLMSSASAIVVANSSTNTNAPSSGSLWSHVGRVNSGSGVYLGAGWVLTAWHIGAGPATFGGIQFPWDGSSLRLTNSDGSNTDMVLFRLRNLPPLPRIPLATSTPAAFAQVDMIGYGHIAGSSQTNIGPYTGFYWSAQPFKSWGNNRVNTGGTTVINVGAGNITVFSTTFDALLKTSAEAQAAAGDSGGGVFLKNGSVWQLAGMLNAIGNSANQPDGTAVYNNQTYSADIATYRAQIEACIAATSPVLSVKRFNDGVTLCWPDTGVTYELWLNHNLASTNWGLLAPALTLTNGQFCAFLPLTNTAVFFRLQKQ
jgi:hypothetical protein